MSPHNHSTEEAGSGEETHQHSFKDHVRKGRVIAGSIVLGALIISASMFVNFHMLFKHLDGSSLAQNTGAGQAAAPSGSGQQATPVNITFKNNTPFEGGANAKVTVVEFADYQCPFCEQLFRSTLPDIKTKYIDTNKIKFIYQDFAFLGPDSNTAAEASQCAADQNMFWQYHDYLFNHQGQEGSAWATADHQKQFAQAIGLNTSQFNQCLDSGKYKQMVLDETSAGRSYGISGTPSVFILKGNNTQIDTAYLQAQLQQQKQVVNFPNGNVFVVGAQPATTFEQAIETALK